MFLMPCARLMTLTMLVLWGTEINDMITNCGLGNPELTNLPRKLNIGLSPSRDDFPHTHINDVGLKAYPDPETGEVCAPDSAPTVFRVFLVAYSRPAGEAPAAASCIRGRSGSAAAGAESLC